MANNDVETIAQVANLPIGDMLRSIALGIAQAQFELDKSSMTVAELMSGTRMLRDLDTGKLVNASGQETNSPVTIDSRVFFGYHIEDGKRVPDKVSMMELGFVPTFYQFVDTVIDIKVAMSLTRVERKENVSSTGAEPETDKLYGKSKSEHVINTTPVDAAYSSSYSFKAEFASVVKTKLVPIPPPASLEDRINLLMERERAAAQAPAVRVTRTTVRVEVAESSSRKMGLKITRPDGSQDDFMIETVKDDAPATAKKLCDVLNSKAVDLLTATVENDTVTITFKRPGVFGVAQEPEARANEKNKFTIQTTQVEQPASP